MVKIPAILLYDSPRLPLRLRTARRDAESPPERGISGGQGVGIKQSPNVEYKSSVIVITGKIIFFTVLTKMELFIETAVM